MVDWCNIVPFSQTLSFSLSLSFISSSLTSWPNLQYKLWILYALLWVGNEAKENVPVQLTNDFCLSRPLLNLFVPNPTNNTLIEKKIIADEMRHSMEAVITLSVALNRRRLDQKRRLTWYLGNQESLQYCGRNDSITQFFVKELNWMISQINEKKKD